MALMDRKLIEFHPDLMRQIMAAVDREVAVAAQLGKKKPSTAAYIRYCCGLDVPRDPQERARRHIARAADSIKGIPRFKAEYEQLNQVYKDLKSTGGR